MRARTLLALSSALALLAGAAAAGPATGGAPAASAPAAPPAAPASGIRLVVASPANGTTVQARDDVVEVRGTAIAAGEDAQRFDVMIVIDVSKSTEEPSLVDVDGDGVVGEDPHLGLYAAGEYPPDVYCTDPDDDILHAEVAAARSLLRGLQPARTRVGLVTFSGDADPQTGLPLRPNQKNAELQVPLTSDFSQVESSLSRVLAQGPHGATDFSAGIRLATTELAGLPGASSTPRPGARKVVLFLTDGFPSFPFGSAGVEDPGDDEAAVQAARLAHAAGIRIDTYALGEGAVARPVAATEVARTTLGSFTPVREPGAIVAALQTVNFANVDDVAVVNLTLREDTPDVRLNPDGTFQAFVPVRPGPNRVLVNAVATDGSVADVELSFDFQVAETDDRMRERQLAELRQLNTELLRQLEAERVKRERRKARVRKEIEIRAGEAH